MLNIMAEMDLLALVHEYRLQIVQGDMRKEAYRYYPNVTFFHYLSILHRRR